MHTHVHIFCFPRDQALDFKEQHRCVCVDRLKERTTGVIIIKKKKQPNMKLWWCYTRLHLLTSTNPIIGIALIGFLKQLWTHTQPHNHLYIIFYARVVVLFCFSLSRTTWRPADSDRNDVVHPTSWLILFSRREIIYIYFFFHMTFMLVNFNYKRDSRQNKKWIYFSIFHFREIKKKNKPVWNSSIKIFFAFYFPEYPVVCPFV